MSNTKETIKAIKKDYQPAIDDLNEKIQEQKEIHEELTQAARILQKHGIDDREVAAKIDKVVEEHNKLVDQKESLLEARNTTISDIRKNEKEMKKVDAYASGYNAYNEAFENGTFEAICNLPQKYLQKEWLKGFNEATSQKGWFPYKIVA